MSEAKVIGECWSEWGCIFQGSFINVNPDLNSPLLDAWGIATSLELPAAPLVDIIVIVLIIKECKKKVNRRHLKYEL